MAQAEKNQITDRIYGVGLVLVVSVVAYLTSFINPVFDPLVVGILIGIFLANLFEGSRFVEEAAFGIKVFLPLGIGLYGFQLRFQNHLPAVELLGLVGIFLCLFVLTYLLSRIARLNPRVSTLLATGASVCGASAIAVISPAIGAKRRETSIAILAVMTTGLFWTILFPVIQNLFSLKGQWFGFLAGTTLPMLGLVKVTAVNAGQKALSVALRLKYLRISSLLFMVTLALLFSGIRQRGLRVPYFMFFFLLFAVLTNLTDIPVNALHLLAQASRFFLTATLSAIGLSTSFEALTEEGLKPFMVTFLSISMVIILTLLVIL